MCVQAAEQRQIQVKQASLARGAHLHLDSLVAPGVDSPCGRLVYPMPFAEITSCFLLFGTHRDG